MVCVTVSNIKQALSVFTGLPSTLHIDYFFHLSLQCAVNFNNNNNNNNNNNSCLVNVKIRPAFNAVL